MEILEIQKDLVQFNSYFEQINMSFNQFLLLGSAPLLVHTGTATHTQALLPQLNQYFKGGEPGYVFISHFESDECGGLSLLMQHFPNVKPICSAVTARQLSGFGISSDALIQSPGQILQTEDFQFEFIAYPSEMHLWDGLILFERTKKVLFSSDLFAQFGKVEEGTVTSDWKKLIANISPEKIPYPAGLEKLQKTLSSLSVSLIAPGHGACIKIE